MDARQPWGRLPEYAGNAVGSVLAGMLRLRYGKITREEFIRQMATAAIERPSPDLLERVLLKRWEPDEIYRPRTREFQVTWEPEGPGQTSLRIMLAIEGDRGEYIAVRTFGERAWEESHRDRLRELCDQWMLNYRFPRLYTHRTRRGDITVICEGQLFVGESGAHQALVEDFVSANVGGAARFWAWLREQPDPIGDGAREPTPTRPRRTLDPLADSLPTITDEDLRKLLDGDGA
jgi:hypothetical protein